MTIRFTRETMYKINYISFIRKWNIYRDTIKKTSKYCSLTANRNKNICFVHEHLVIRQTFIRFCRNQKGIEALEGVKTGPLLKYNPTAGDFIMIRAGVSVYLSVCHIEVAIISCTRQWH